MPKFSKVRVERAGSQRCLVVPGTPDSVWPQLRQFWQDNGFQIKVDKPELGIMETEWAERRQRVETDGLRGILSNVLGSSYSTGERDRYRTRIERTASGATEIYVTHRGMEEVVTGIQKDSSVWQARPSNPELEIEYLRRILVQLGRAPVPAVATAAAAGSGPAPATERTRVLTDADPSSLSFSEGFDRAWREVGLVLDRVGFTVEDRDRSKGTYFVRYVDLDRRDPRQGTLSRFFSGERKDLAGQRYRIVVEGSASQAVIQVREENGQPPASAENKRVANRIIALLHEELK